MSDSDRPEKVRRFPELDDIDPELVPFGARKELERLRPGAQEWVTKLLAGAVAVMEEDPAKALEYSLEAARVAKHSAVVREAAGVAAYQCGDFSLARRELKAAQRMSRSSDLVGLIGDCERALGEPQRAVDLISDEAVAGLSYDSRCEALIVKAGARSDLGQHQAAISLLLPLATSSSGDPATKVRVAYALAQTYVEAGEDQRAQVWFARAAEADVNLDTDAADRLADWGGGQ